MVTWSGGQFAGGRLPAGHPLRELVRAAHADVTGATGSRERGAPYGSDLRLYAGAGIPTLHYGPGDVALAHGPDEAVDLDEVVTVTRASCWPCCGPAARSDAARGRGRPTSPRGAGRARPRPDRGRRCRPASSCTGTTVSR